MTGPHSSVKYEGRDTQNRKIFVLGIWLFVIMIGCSLLMIPVVSYFWSWAEKNGAHVGTPAASQTTPNIILEVDPSSDLEKMRLEYEKNGSAEKIKAAMQKSLEEGFPVRS